MADYNLIIVGGGIAGISAAIKAKEKEIRRVLLIEKEEALGGILKDAEYEIGLGEKLTGEAYRIQMIEALKGLHVEIRLETTALKIEENLAVACISGRKGIEKLTGENILMATGVREKGKNPLKVVGDPVTGIYTTLMARKILKMPDVTLGKKILIIGTTKLYRILDLLAAKQCEVVGIVGDDEELGKLNSTYDYYKGYELVAIYGEGRIRQAMLHKGESELIVDCDAIILAMPFISDGILALKSGIVLSEMAGPKVDTNYETSMKHVYACGGCVKPNLSLEQVIYSVQDAVSHMLIGKEKETVNI